MTENKAMTLEHVRDGLRGMKTFPQSLFNRWADAISAHLSQPAQAVDVRSVVVKAVGGYLERSWPDNPVSYDDMAAHITRALSTAQAEGWRDIATAPKDGRYLLLCRPNYQPFSGRWIDDEWQDSMQLCREPSHWQPLPATPAPDKE